MTTFWMVYVEGRNGSTVKHPTAKSAMEEAERVARQEANSSRRVYVLKALAFCEVDSPPVRWGSLGVL